MNNNKVALPAWWPACPYPADIFPMDLERYAELVPDPEQRTALSGALGRHFWEIASAEIWRSYLLQLQDGTIVYHLPEPDWRQAPGWAQWWAIDKDSRAWWYAQRPGLRPGGDGWVDNGGEVVKCYGAWDRVTPRLAMEWHSILAAQWQDSLRERPAVNHDK